MAAPQMEFFVLKFHELACIGVNANLNFNCSNGKVFATFAAELGQANPQHFPTILKNVYTSEFPKQPNQTSVIKPSKLRRRKRQKEERDSALEDSSSSADNISQDSTPDGKMNAALPIDEPFIENSEDRPANEVLRKKTPLNCIRHADGCPNLVNSYFNEYTAICNSCSLLMENMLKSTPYPHDICPCCHQPNDVLLSLCAECLSDIQDDGLVDTGRGS